MRADVTISHPVIVFRPRFRRLLAGKYSSGDMADLFRVLRPIASPGSIIREIGDLIAHPEARDRGLAVSRLGDTLASKAWVVKRLRDGAPVMNDEWIQALLRNLRRMNDESLAGSRSILSASSSSTPPYLESYAKLQSEANAAIKRLTKPVNGVRGFNTKSPNFKRDLSVLQFLSDIHPITSPAYEVKDLLTELWGHLSELGLVTDADTVAFSRFELPVGSFIVSLLHRSTIKIGEDKYFLKARRCGPTTPSPPGDLHPIKDGSVSIDAEIAGVVRKNQRPLGDSGLIFVIYGPNDRYCEPELLAKESWSDLTLELSGSGKLTFVDYE